MGLLHYFISLTSRVGVHPQMALIYGSHQ